MIKTKTLILTILFLGLAFWSCENGTEPEEELYSIPYIIYPDVPDSTTGTDWFNVVNLDTDVSKGVPAVIQSDGFVYLPIHSHPPTFDNKVVSGVFVPDTNYYNDMVDTVFRVTEHLRDTTLNEKDPNFVPNDLFHVSIYEGHFDFVSDEPGPHNVIHIVTDSIYPCCNWTLIVQQENFRNAATLNIEGIHKPEVCLTALGPAYYYGELNLSDGDFTIIISYEHTVDQLFLSVTDSLIHITSVDTSFISLDEYLIWRYRSNSFVYSCGTLEETTWIYEDFRDSILSIQGIEQFYYPDSGRIPYPRYPSGHYVDHPCLYFQYADESIWEQVKEKLVDYSINTISQYSGVGVYVENYLGERELSWKYD